MASREGVIEQSEKSTREIRGHCLTHRHKKWSAELMMQVDNFWELDAWESRVGKKPGKFEKTHGKNCFLPGKMKKTGKIAFFQNTCLKSIHSLIEKFTKISQYYRE
jgi:hypothetical protein